MIDILSSLMTGMVTFGFNDKQLSLTSWKLKQRLH